MSRLPDGVLQMIASPDAFVFEFASEQAFRESRLFVGLDAVPIERLDAYDGPKLDLVTADDMERIGVEAVFGRPPTAALNAAEEWTVAGSSTLFLRLDDDAPGQRFRLTLDRMTALPARPGHAVEVLVAAHRMRGTLHLNFLDRRGQTRTHRARPIDGLHLGGKNRRNHAAVSEPVPDDASIVGVEIVVEVGECTDAGSSRRPYVFLSDLRVGVADRLRQAAPFVVAGEVAARPRGQAGGGARNALGFGIRVAPRRAAQGDALGHAVAGAMREEERSESVFARARVTGLSRADKVVLRRRGNESELPLPRAPKVRSGGISAPRWMVTSRARGEATLMVDGRVFGAVRLDQGANSVVLPREAMDGAEHVLELKDRHALRTLCAEIAVIPAQLTPYTTVQNLNRRPLPSQLAPQGAKRYAALQAVLASGPTAEDALEIAHAHMVLGIGFNRLRADDYKPLRFPRHEAPDVSVVIPAHNKFAVTYACLCALRIARCEATFEVVLVDDASSDETATVETWVSGLTVVRNAEPLRFLAACNAGVAASRGRYVALLNNDTEPTLGWLDALIEPFARFDRVGLTGAMLLYPDNRVQEAGGVVWASGNPMNYGRGQLPTDPRFRYVREVDYVSGAAMLTTRDIWDELGGLSDYLAPMYFEDTDFAFKIRESGRRVMYAPHACVYHYEGQTAGTDVTRGFKAYQEVNRPKFKARWAEAFRSFGPEGGNADIEKDRGVVGRVLVIDKAVPQADRDAGSYATLQEMRLLQSLGFKVTFLPYSLSNLGAYVDDLERQGIETIVPPYYLSPVEYIEENGSLFDAVYVYRYTVARRLLDFLRQFAPQARIILMNADIHFLREIRMARQTGDAEALTRAAATRKAELDVVRRVDLVLSYTEVEHAVLMSHVEDVAVARCPWVAETVTQVPSFGARGGVMFLGNFRHPPNLDAVRWFLENVWPQLKGGRSGGFHIYGSGLQSVDIAFEGPGVHRHGYVERVDDAHAKHRVFAAPIWAGAGIKGKVVGALAAGVPCVLSPLAAEGMAVRPGVECLIAETPQEWCEAISRLHEDEAIWREMSAAGRAFVQRTYSFAGAREAMRTIFEGIGLPTKP